MKYQKHTGHVTEREACRQAVLPAHSYSTQMQSTDAVVVLRVEYICKPTKMGKNYELCEQTYSTDRKISCCSRAERNGI